MRSTATVNDALKARSCFGKEMRALTDGDVELDELEGLNNHTVFARVTRASALKVKINAHP